MQFQPTGLEGLDDILVADMKKKGIHPKDITLLPEGGGWLLVEFGGESKDESDDQARKLMEHLKGVSNPPSMKLFDNEAEEEHLWKVRESGLGATARIPGEKDAWEGWEDSAVPPDRVGPYLRDLRKLFQKFGYNCSLYGHFGQGCIHTRIDFELKTYEGVKHFRKFLDEAGDLVVSYGGSISGEHGDGQSKAALLPKMFGPELVRAFGEFKAIWDPENKMNPHKVVDPYLPGENLRLGPTYNPPHVETHFKYLDDKGSFAYATERCVGIGECRKEEAGTMCPSYMVTKEEMHSTRGRAHLLFEMLQGDPMKGGWKTETVREAFDLCLACKGCRTECPMNVDMATYKAEFLSHYYEGRLRPRHAYAMGLIYWWARLASLAPGVVNLITHAPVVGKVFQMTRRDLDPADDAVVRPRDVRVVVPPPSETERGHAAGGPLARHLQQPLPSPDGQGGRRDPGSRRVPGCRPEQVALLRPAALRLRHARYGQGAPARDPRHVAAGDRGEHTGRRPGAELRGRLPGRDDEFIPDGRGRQAALGQHLHPQRIPRKEGARLPPAPN